MASNTLNYKGSTAKQEILYITITPDDLTVEPSPDKEQLKQLLTDAGLTVEEIEESPCG